MVDLNGAWLRFIDADKMTLAFLPWDPLVGIAGAFFGDAFATGRAAMWEIQFPDGRRARGVSRAGNIFPDETLRVERRTVEDWMGELSSLIELAPKAGDSLLVIGLPDHVTTLTRDEWAVPADKVAIYCVDMAAPGADQTVSLTKIPEGKQYVRTEVRFSSDIDLSPLANLATAVGWGIALRGLVDEWRAWHPAARVSWDLDVDGNVWFTFAVDGIGEVLRDSVSTRVRYSHDVDDLMEEAQRSAAMAMAPHYVAPSPKAENRDAALRRFADEMRAAKAADRGAA